ncbi:MAG TPA: hypothetical protein PKZ53_24715 [Acidobacteriota bacterium]|nr:hypothetical protein [Acidobacteriota bacterium]
MDDSTKKKAIAAAKITFGAARVISGIATATGHGLLGTYLKSHHMRSQAVALGKRSVDGGIAMFKNGLDDWKKS